MSQHPHRAVRALTASALTAGAVFLAAPAAQAEPDCGQPPLQYSVDGGTSWANSAAIPAATATVQVRLAGVPTAGCDYHVSLGSYETQGPTWETSGTQTFLGWATTTLNREHYRATLDVSGHLPHCFGELALYGVDGKYDGADSDHPLPHYPDEPFSGLMIASWNGGAACTSPSPKPTPTPTPTPTATPTPTPTPTRTQTQAPVRPSKPPTAPTTPSTPAVSATPAATATTAPGLASTGGNGTLLAATALGGAALLTAGAATLRATRRHRKHT
ncbi:hypothetical protein ABT095_19780 [Kitasatospora sp. NPDC002227]|uniref:hypothetical protein n=1 Tax=Kitasatospora sp. NPDC002227 TaxID=3154773 RepID=UPI0033205871